MALKEVSGPSPTSTQGIADGDKVSGRRVGPGIFTPFPHGLVTYLPSEDLALVGGQGAVGMARKTPLQRVKRC